MHERRVLLIALTFCTFAVSAQTAVQTYPAKPIRIIVPFPPGSGVDILARLMGPALSESLGKPLVIDNRAGGNGITGAAMAAKAIPDGYTLLITSGALLTVTPYLVRNTPYAPQRDFAMVTLLASVPNILVVPPALPAKSVRELVALASARPGALNYASTGIGTTSHLAAELFKARARVQIMHVPYQGSAQALTDLIGGQVDMFFNNLLAAAPHVRSGKLRALAVTSPVRLHIMPDVPAIAESGFPGFEAETWYGLLAPSGTPGAVISKLHDDAVKVVRAPVLGERLAAEGTRALGTTPREFSAHIKSDSEKWGALLRAASIHAN